jgi:hypothetical protein
MCAVVKRFGNDLYVGYPVLHAAIASPLIRTKHAVPTYTIYSTYYPNPNIEGALLYTLDGTCLTIPDMTSSVNCGPVSVPRPSWTSHIRSTFHILGATECSHARATIRHPHASESSVGPAADCLRI